PIGAQPDALQGNPAAMATAGRSSAPNSSNASARGRLAITPTTGVGATVATRPISGSTAIIPPATSCIRTARNRRRYQEISSSGAILTAPGSPGLLALMATTAAT